MKKKSETKKNLIKSLEHAVTLLNAIRHDAMRNDVEYTPTDAGVDLENLTSADGVDFISALAEYANSENTE